MKAEIISVGTELLLGQIADTNASYLAAELSPLGIDLYWISLVGDNRERLKQVLRQAWGRSDLILTTGGLGPTEDDVTREAIAEMLGEEMRVEPALEQELRDLFKRFGRDMPSRNIKQATLIPSARSLPNPRGTAPGWWVERDGRILVAMPGPPGEMQLMWANEVSPQLRQRLDGAVIISRTLKTLGISEAAVDEMVAPLLSSTNPTLAIYSKPDGIQLRLTAKAQNREQAREMIASMETSLRSILGDSVWGMDDDTLEGMVGTLLMEKGLTLATMESFTGGLLASILSSAPGGSAYFKGGLIAYSDEIKIALGVEPQLIVRHGSVSPEVAGAMAGVARSRLRADLGVGSTGVVETDEKAAGTVYFAIDDGSKKRTFHGSYSPDRPEAKRRAASRTLFELRRALLELG